MPAKELSNTRESDQTTPSLPEESAVPFEAGETSRQLSKKYLLTIGGAVILLLLTAAGAVGYLTYKNYQFEKQAAPESTPSSKPIQPPTQPVIKPDPTAGWETYTNIPLQYTLGYPSDWKLKESVSMDHPYIIITDPMAQDMSPGQTEILKGAMIEVYAENREPWYSDKSISESLPLTGPAGSGDSYTPLTTSGINGTIYTRQDEDEYTNRNTQVKGFGFFRTLNNKELIFDIKLTIVDFKNLSSEQINSCTKTFDQVLPTFKFLDQGRGTNEDWLVHFQEKVMDYFKGFTLRYPSTWKLETQRQDDPAVLQLTLERNGSIISILQGPGSGASCLYPGDPDREGMFARYGEYKEMVKESNVVWRVALPENYNSSRKSTYTVCQKEPERDIFAGVTSIGFFTISISSDNEPQVLNEIYEILRGIEVVN